MNHHPEVRSAADALVRQLKSAASSKVKADAKSQKDSARPSLAQWPDPLPFDDSLPVVDRFDFCLLPESLKALVYDVSERMQTPPDFAAASMVLAIAGAVNRRAQVQPKRRDTWTKPPNLWGAIIGPPGVLKSPVLSAFTRPLRLIEQRYAEEHETSKTEYELKVELHQLEVSKWKETAKQTIDKKGKKVPDRPELSSIKPTAKRLILNDCTFEKTHQIMADNPAGIFIIRDELTGWLSMMERSGREGERPFALEAWNGTSGFTVDRVDRGTTRVQHCCMSLFGGIQPARLASYLADAAKDGPSNDGLIQRFQILVWPDSNKEYVHIDREPDIIAGERAELMFSRLVEMDPGEQRIFRFCGEAQDRFDEWFTALERRLRGDDLHPNMQAHLSKYRSLMPSLALLFTLADWASSRDLNLNDVQQRGIPLANAQRAVDWCKYLESHARRVYSCVTSAKLRAAKDLGGRLRRGDLGDVFQARDVYRRGWSGLDTPESVRAAAEILVELNWIQEKQLPTQAIGGRPTIQYRLNPKVALMKKLTAKDN